MENMHIVRRINDIRAAKRHVLEMLTEDLSELGFEKITPTDSRYWAHKEKNVQVFLNPVIASRIVIYTDFPELGKLTELAIATYNKKAEQKAQRLIPLELDDFQNPELITSFIISEVERHMNND